MRPEVLDLAYMAGLFDGEGYISIRYQMQRRKYDTYSLMVGINMVDKEAIELFMDSFGGVMKLRESKNENWRPQYRWRIESSSAYELLKTLSPFMILKKEKAELAILFQESKKTYNYRSREEKDSEKRLFLDMRVLNRRGKDAVPA